MGAYHWIECDPRSPQYNPPLVARYQMVADRIARGSRLLDVGCGDGYLIGLVHTRCENVVGIEPDATAVVLAHRQLRDQRRIAVVQGRGSELPFGGRRFDVVVLADVIEHLEDPAGCLAEVARVVTAEGTVLVTTPKWRPDRRWDPLHVIEYTPDELRQCLQAHFAHVHLSFFWPLWWSDLYATRVGWRLVRVAARRGFNPFLRRGNIPHRFGQILAVCTQPQCGAR